MIIILFGLTGSGKNFVGETLADYLGYHFWDADLLLPEDMKDCIAHKKLFTEEQRDLFTLNIINEIHNLKKQYPNLIVSQALYREKNRKKIQAAFPDAVFIQVIANADKISQRLKLRNNTVGNDYAKQISTYFEDPQLPHLKLFNNDDQTKIIEGFDHLVNKKYG